VEAQVLLHVGDVGAIGRMGGFDPLSPAVGLIGQIDGVQGTISPAYRCGGHLSAEEYRSIVADFDDRYTRHRKLRSYTEITDDFRGIARFFDWDRFAMVTGEEWITRWTGVHDPVRPHGGPHLPDDTGGRSPRLDQRTRRPAQPESTPCRFANTVGAPGVWPFSQLGGAAGRAPR
jgi:hypothetical protein